MAKLVFTLYLYSRPVAKIIVSSATTILHSVEELPHNEYDSAIMLKAAASDVLDEIVKIPGIGSVRKVARPRGCIVFILREICLDLPIRKRRSNESDTDENRDTAGRLENKSGLVDDVLRPDVFVPSINLTHDRSALRSSAIQNGCTVEIKAITENEVRGLRIWITGATM